MVAGEGAKDDGKIKKVSLPLLKNLIFSRTGKGPKAKNNTPPAATEPQGIGPLLAEARQVVKDYPTSLFPPTNRAPVRSAVARDRSHGSIRAIWVIVTSTRGAN